MQRQSGQCREILIRERPYHVTIQRFIDDEMTEAARRDDPNARVTRERLDCTSDG